jgi:hypothetical protein
MTVLESIDTIANRFPPRRESMLVFAACILPIHMWTSILMLYNIPGLILKASVWQILGVAAYVFAFALLECLIIFGLLIVISVLLPGHVLRVRFVYLGTALAIILSGLAFLLNTPAVLERIWIFIPLGLAIVLFLVCLVRRPKLQAGTRSLAERLTLLAGLYITFDIACVLYLFSRWIWL